MNDPFSPDPVGKRNHRNFVRYNAVRSFVEQASSQDVGNSFDTKFFCDQLPIFDVGANGT